MDIYPVNLLYADKILSGFKNNGMVTEYSAYHKMLNINYLYGYNNIESTTEDEL